MLLKAIHQIHRRPGKVLEIVQPGEEFTASETEAEELVRLSAAVIVPEAAEPKKAAPKKAEAAEPKKAAPKKAEKADDAKGDDAKGDAANDDLV